jgi:hypothetical protein
MKTKPVKKRNRRTSKEREGEGKEKDLGVKRDGEKRKG